MKKKELRQTAEWQNKKTDIRKLERKFRNILILTLVVVAAMSAMGHYLMKLLYDYNYECLCDPAG